MKPQVLIVCATVMAAVTVACSDSKSAMNPVSPSAVVLDGGQSVASGGVASTQAKGGVPGPPQGKGGNGNGNDKGNGNGNNQPPSSNTSPAAPVVKKVEIEGLISAKGAGSVTVNAQQIAVSSSCPIRHGQAQFAFADLKVGDRVHVRANRTTTTGSGPGATSTTTLDATEVILQNPEDGEGSGDDTPTALVSVAATDAAASETGPDTGTFTLTRAGDTTAALTVTITLTGTATNGTDYQLLPLTVSFAAGQATATVVVAPLTDNVVEGPETVTITVIDGAAYTAGSPATATVTIAG